MLENIPVFVPHIHIDTVKHLMDAFDVGWLGMGSSTKEFEERIAKYLGLENRYVVATNTGTSALHIGLLVAGVGPGDEVITTSFNYVSDHQAIVATGAEVVMCDIREDDLGIDCEKAEALISERTKAMLPLHFAGIPCDIDGVYALAEKYGLRVIEDCCHAFGTIFKRKNIGSFGDISCFSFDPVKVITSIDGGAVVVPSEEEMQQLKRLRFLGVDKETTERYKNKRAWDYDVLCQGFRYHMTNILASVGISQIKRVDEFIRSRREVCRTYNEAFGVIGGLVIPQTDYSGVSPFIYFLRVLDGRREALIEHLANRAIDTGVHFIPVHEHTFFKDSRRGEMRVTDEITQQMLTLPLHSNMRPDFRDRVIDGVTSFFE
jgi:dTDP-4-amino-4,6-dideoxygalactose transaminase